MIWIEPGTNWRPEGIGITASKPLTSLRVAVMPLWVWVEGMAVPAGELITVTVLP